MNSARSAGKIRLSQQAEDLLAQVVRNEYFLTPTNGWRIIVPFKYRHDTTREWAVSSPAAEELRASGCIKLVAIPVNVLEAYQPSPQGEDLVRGTLALRVLDRIVGEHWRGARASDFSGA